MTVFHLLVVASGGIACVASVPARGERGPREGVFRIRAAREMGRSKKLEGGAVGEGSEGNACPQTPRF